jgi:hypothetical protein
MQASAGDHLRVEGRHVGDRPLVAEVLEVHGKDGQPPYLVRWEDGREGTFFPGSDAVVERGPKRATKRSGSGSAKRSGSGSAKRSGSGSAKRSGSGSAKRSGA